MLLCSLVDHNMIYCEPSKNTLNVVRLELKKRTLEEGLILFSIKISPVRLIANTLDKPTTQIIIKDSSQGIPDWCNISSRFLVGGIEEASSHAANLCKNGRQSRREIDPLSSQAGASRPYWIIFRLGVRGILLNHTVDN